MPQLMPKHIEKGPMIRKLEEAWGSALGRATTLLRARAWSAASKAGEATCNLAELLPGLTEDERDHLRTDWFGDPDQAFWVSAQPGEANVGQLAERVIGAGLIEALEVSLGLGSGESLDPYLAALAQSSNTPLAAVAENLGIDVDRAGDQLALRRDLPIDIFWLCDMPLFEAYLAWNERQLTVIVATAATDSPMFALVPRDELQERAKTSWNFGLLVVQSGAPDDPAALTATSALLDRGAARWMLARRKLASNVMLPPTAAGEP